MIGGAISGYCPTGSRRKATPPRITKITDTTAGKIGRRMEKSEIRLSGKAHAAPHVGGGTVQNRPAPALQTSAPAFAIGHGQGTVLHFIASLSGTRLVAAFWRR